ncbi:MAG: hypothetical protein ACOC1S_05385 [bacterium]
MSCVRVCPRCDLKIKKPGVFRCPRCSKVLLKKCSECDGCLF